MEETTAMGMAPIEARRRALVRQAGTCCSDPLFRRFVGAHDSEDAARRVRELCGVASRADLRPGSTAARRWRALHAEYVLWRDYPELCGMRAMARRVAASVAVIVMTAVTLPAVLWATPAAAIDCQASKGNVGYWSWREIEGRKCWYLGHPGRDKRSLQWPVASRSRQGSPGRVPRVQGPTSPPRPETQPAATPGPMVAEAGAVLAPVTTRWPEVDLPPIDSAAAVTAAPLRPVPSGASEPTTSDRRHQPVPPPAERSPALTVTMLLVALGLVAAGAVLIRPNTKHEALR